MENLTFKNLSHQFNFTFYTNCVSTNLKILESYSVENPEKLTPKEIYRNLYLLEIDLLNALENVRKLKPLALDL
jgi:hypothetical protein